MEEEREEEEEEWGWGGGVVEEGMGKGARGGVAGRRWEWVRRPKRNAPGVASHVSLASKFPQTRNASHLARSEPPPDSSSPQMLFTTEGHIVQKP